MLDYRLYFLDGAGDHIERFEAVEAVGDTDAIEIANLYTGSWPLELWLRGRKVESFPAQDRASIRTAGRSDNGAVGRPATIRKQWRLGSRTD